MKSLNRVLGTATLLSWGLLAGGPRATAQTGTLPKFGHVFIVVEENDSYSQTTGSAMPYLTSLYQNTAGLTGVYGGLATNYNADTHPSIGNYFTLSTGQILTNDDSQTPSSFPVSVDNIAHQLQLAGNTWKSYAECLPSVGYTGDDVTSSCGTYYVRHNPLAYVTNINTAANLVPFSQFASDLDNNALPEFSFIVPDGCDDAHDCSLSTADSWLENNIGPLLNSALFQKDGLLVVAFDEDASTGTPCGLTTGAGCGGHVEAVVVSPFVKNVAGGFQSSTSYEHENTLRLMAQGLGLVTFPGASATVTANFSEFFNLGTGAVSLSPMSLNFGSEAVNTTSAGQTITVTNTGTVNVTVSGVGLTGANVGDFAKSADTCTGATVAPSSSCAVSVTFTPSAAGSRVATLSITDNAAGSPQSVALSGTGTDFSIAPAPGSSTTATITAGQTATFTLVLAPNGFSGTVSFTCTGAPAAATCTTPASIMLNGSTPENITVTVATTARSIAPPASQFVPPHSGQWARHLLPLQWLWLLALAGLLGLAMGHENQQHNGPPLEPAGAAARALATMLLVIATWAGCGGGGGLVATSSGTPAGTYALTITATSGSLTHNTIVMLTVR